MPYLIAESTQQVTFTPDVTIDELALIVSDGGATLDLGQPVLSGAAWAMTVESADIPAALVGHTLEFRWNMRAAAQIRTVVERYVVLDGIGAALCTRQQVKARSLITTIAQDATIDQLITTVLPKVSTRYGCEFMPHTTGTRTFDFDHRLIDLVASDLRSATSVVLDPNGTPRTLTPGVDYILRPCRLTGTFEEIQLSAALTIESDFSRRFGMKQIEVTGDWGIWDTVADVPDDIQEAAVECVLSWLSKPVSDISAIDSQAPRQISAGIAQTWDIPLSAHRAFQPYNRNLGVY
jgi:hypothetical protein